MPSPACASEGIDAEHVRRSRPQRLQGRRAGGRPGALRRALCRGVRRRLRARRPTGCGAPWRRCWPSPRAAFVQTRIEWGNGERNWLTRAQRLMQDAHFAVEQDVRARRGVPFQFNGTGGIWRRAAVEEAGGWSHDTLSEDLDLVLRTHLKGWGGVFLMEPHVVGELPQQAGGFQRPAEPLVEGLRAGRAQAAAADLERRLVGRGQVHDDRGAGPAAHLSGRWSSGVVALILSVVGHGYLLGFFRFLLWLWLLRHAGRAVRHDLGRLSPAAARRPRRATSSRRRACRR